MINSENESKDNKISIISFIKNLIFSPKQSIYDLGDSSSFSTIATFQTILFSFFIPVAYLISWVVIGVGNGENIRLRLSFLMWINSSVLIMFYNLILTFLAAKIIYILKNKMGFNGSKEKANQIAVLSACVYFLTTSLLILVSFIHNNLVGFIKWFSPVISSGMIFYVLFNGFNRNYETDEIKKIQFAIIISGVFMGLGICINLLSYEFLTVALISNFLNK